LYLPDEIDQARILITVKAYPKPSHKYSELVCTAGLLEGEKWVRIYPVLFRFLMDNDKYPKYSWINLDIVRSDVDFRPESYKPKLGLDEKFILERTLGTKNSWAARRQFILNDVFYSMKELLQLAHGEGKKSLATVKPKEILGFYIEETDREWKESWQNTTIQAGFSDLGSNGDAEERELIRKVPYNYYYRFITEGDDNPRRLKIEDWEIGALFWNCLKITRGDEKAANDLVKKKYFDEFVNKKDLHFFLGTTLEFHRRRTVNPFMIIGVFYPPITKQTQMQLVTS